MAWPTFRHLGEDRFSEGVPRTCEGEGDVCVETLERRSRARATDAGVERAALVTPGHSSCEPQSKCALLRGRLRERASELGIDLNGRTPPLDSARSLQTGDRRHEMATGEVVHRGERLSIGTVRQLLGDRRGAERTARGNLVKCARDAAKLSGDPREIVHAPRVDRAARLDGTRLIQYEALRLGGLIEQL